MKVSFVDKGISTQFTIYAVKEFFEKQNIHTVKDTFRKSFTVSNISNYDKKCIQYTLKYFMLDIYKYLAVNHMQGINEVIRELATIIYDDIDISIGKHLNKYLSDILNKLTKSLNISITNVCLSNEPVAEVVIPDTLDVINHKVNIISSLIKNDVHRMLTLDEIKKLVNEPTEELTNILADYIYNDRYFGDANVDNIIKVYNNLILKQVEDISKKVNGVIKENKIIFSSKYIEQFDETEYLKAYIRPRCTAKDNNIDDSELRQIWIKLSKIDFSSLDKYLEQDKFKLNTMRRICLESKDIFELLSQSSYLSAYLELVQTVIDIKNPMYINILNNINAIVIYENISNWLDIDFKRYCKIMHSVVNVI